MPQLIHHGNRCLADKPIYSLAIEDLQNIPERIEIGVPHFVCFLVMDAEKLSEIQIQTLGRHLLNLGCTYFCIWGPDCERAHDLIDLADLDDHPDGPWALTSWHSEEPLLDALWTALNAAWPDPAFENYPHAVLALTIGSNDWANEVRHALSDLPSFNHSV